MKTFEQHAEEAQMSDADRIAHAVTWNAAIAAAVKACRNRSDVLDQFHTDEAVYRQMEADKCGNEISALATE